MLNKYGLNMVGLKKVAGESSDTRLGENGHYLQLNYNKKSGEIWTDYHCDFGGNCRTQYHDEDILTVGYISSKLTMQEIADRIKGAI